MKSLKGKKVIVTGAGMGIGRATARLLAGEGADVTIWDVNAAALKDAEKDIRAAGPGKVFAFRCDVTDKESVLRLVKKSASAMGGIDILVNNAGIERHGRFCSRPVSEWEKVVDVNLLSIFYTTHAVLPVMYKQNSGIIVNISSAGGIIGVADLAAYCATKWAVWGFTESIRLEVIADGKDIHLSSVHPHFLREGLFAGGHLNWFGEMLLPRIKSPDIVARAVVGKAIGKRRNTVKIPATLQLGVLMRGLVPDSVIMFLASKVFGIGTSMETWVGRGGSKSTGI